MPYLRSQVSLLTAQPEVECVVLPAFNVNAMLAGSKKGAYLDAIYFCPHHPHKGYEGEVPELKVECECRKPKPGMLLRAAKDLNIDLSKSYMIGDGENDVKAGIAAGCKTVLISGEGDSFNQDICVSSLKEFVDRVF